MGNAPKHKCPVCGYYTLEDRHANDICPVCFWEDDCFVVNENDFSPANGITLAEAKENWESEKCSRFSDKPFCRNPYPSELPWIYEHDAEITGRDDRDAMVDVMRTFDYISNAVHSHEKEYFTAATTVFNRCLAEAESNGAQSDYYISEKLTESDKEEMIRIYELLADYGDYAFHSNIKLAECYMNGFGVERDLNKTGDYLRAAAELADSMSESEAH